MAFKRKSEQDEAVPLDEKFKVFCAKDPISVSMNVELIPLSQINYWLKEAKILDMINVTTTDTGLCFFKFQKRAINYEEFLNFLQDLCKVKKLNFEIVKLELEKSSKPKKKEIE